MLCYLFSFIASLSTRFKFFLFFLFFSLLSCSEPSLNPCETQQNARNSHQGQWPFLVFQENDSIHIQGLYLSTKPQEHISAYWKMDGSLSDKVSGFSDEHGIFSLSIKNEDTPSAQLILQTGAQEWSITPNNSACFISHRTTLPGTPSDVVLGTCGNTPVAFTSISSDSTILAIEPDGHILSTTYLSSNSDSVQENDVPANPWSIRLLPSGLAIVTLFGTHEIALIDPCQGIILQKIKVDEQIPVEPAIELPIPQDPDGDGQSNTQVHRMIPHTPQGIAVLSVFSENNDFTIDIAIAYTNILWLARNQHEKTFYGPGSVSFFRIHHQSISLVHTMTIPAYNTGALTADTHGGLWISGSGSLVFNELGEHSLETPSTLFHIEDTQRIYEQPNATYTPSLKYSTHDFSLGMPVLLEDDTIAVGSLTSSNILLFDTKTEQSYEPLRNPDANSASSTSIDSIFALQTMPGNLVVGGSFNHDTLFLVAPSVYKTTSLTLPVLPTLQGSTSYIHGLQNVVWQENWKSTSSEHIDGVAALALSSELVWLRWWQIYGF
jgi:hypothetical protein